MTITEKDSHEINKFNDEKFFKRKQKIKKIKKFKFIFSYKNDEENDHELSYTLCVAFDFVS
jgi:hypothetical protein